MQENKTDSVTYGSEIDSILNKKNEEILALQESLAEKERTILNLNKYIELLELSQKSLTVKR